MRRVDFDDAPVFCGGGVFCGADEADTGVVDEDVDAVEAVEDFAREFFDDVFACDVSGECVGLAATLIDCFDGGLWMLFEVKDCDESRALRGALGGCGLPIPCAAPVTTATRDGVVIFDLRLSGQWSVVQWSVVRREIGEKVASPSTLHPSDEDLSWGSPARASLMMTRIASG